MSNIVIDDVRDIVDEECPNCGSKKFCITYDRTYEVDLENDDVYEPSNFGNITSVICAVCGEIIE